MKYSFDSVHKDVQNGVGFELNLSDFASKGKIGARGGFKDFIKAAKRKLRGSNPIAPNQADIVNWILYDRIAFAASAVIPNLTKLFVTPIGTNSKTKVDTNLDQVSRLPDPLWFNTTHMGFFFNNNVLAIDLDAFFNTEYMEFWVGQKAYLEGPVQCFPSGAGRFGSVALGTMAAAATSFANNQGSGWPVLSNLYDVRLPGGLNLGVDGGGNPVVADGLIGITILQGQQFNVQLKADGGGATLAATGAVPVPGTGLTVACYLHGILSRGVQ